MSKIGIVGLGNWGRKLLETFDKLSEVEICCTTGSKENIEWLNKQFPAVKHTTNFEKVIQNKEINAVIIATPINTHYELVKKAIIAEKNVFVEKPLSTNVEQAKELVKIAQERKRVLFTGNVFLYSNIFIYLEKLNKTSPFEHITWNWNKFGTFNENIFWNLAWHDILMTIKLMGKITNLQLISKAGFSSDVDITTIALDFEQRKKSVISINRIADKTEKTALFIAKGKSYAWNNDSLSSLNKGAMEFEHILKSIVPSLDMECKTFISLLDNDGSKMDDNEIILETIRIIEALIKQSHDN